MSYILEALKKAEAERQLGGVPGLHAQPVPALNHASASSSKKILLMVAAAGALLGAALLYWQKPWRNQEVSPLPPMAQAPAAPLAPAQEASPPAQVGTEETLKGEFAVPPPSAREDAPVTAPRKPKQAAKVAEPQAALPAAPAQKAKSPEPPIALAQPAATGAPAGAPAISIAGYVYSDNPNDRQLLVNKKLLHEGEEAAPGLVLERMLPKTAVFNYNGTRFQVPY